MSPRNSGVVLGVLWGHAWLLWLALHPMGTPAPTGHTEQVIMASVVTQVPTPVPAPITAAARPKPIAASAPQQPQVHNTPAAAESSPPSTATPSAPASPAPTLRAAMPALATVVQPSSDADYLHNPPPAYPRMSRRMGEQGTVLVRVFINTEGRAEQADIRTSSGYVRLDEAALDTVRRWRYVPGRRAGVAEAMWFNVPIRFVLD